MNYIKTISLITLTFVAIALSSCGSSSDPETEKAIAGTWKISYTESEDGMSVIASATESYSLEDHRFNAEIKYSFGYPINERLCTITYSGEWKASKKELTTYIDEKTVEFSFNKSLLDRSDREEFESEMLAELKKQSFTEVMPFKSEIGDTFDIIDEDGEIVTYHRVD